MKDIFVYLLLICLTSCNPFKKMAVIEFEDRVFVVNGKGDVVKVYKVCEDLTGYTDEGPGDPSYFPFSTTLEYIESDAHKISSLIDSTNLLIKEQKPPPKPDEIE